MKPAASNKIKSLGLPEMKKGVFGFWLKLAVWEERFVNKNQEEANTPSSQLVPAARGNTADPGQYKGDKEYLDSWFNKAQ